MCRIVWRKNIHNFLIQTHVLHILILYDKYIYLLIIYIWIYMYTSVHTLNIISEIHKLCISLIILNVCTDVYMYIHIYMINK